MTPSKASASLEESWDSALDRHLDGWGILNQLLMLPATGLSALVVMLAMAAILNLGHGAYTFARAAREFGPDLLVSLAGAIGAWVSVLLTGRFSRC